MLTSQHASFLPHMLAVSSQLLRSPWHEPLFSQRAAQLGASCKHSLCLLLLWLAGSPRVSIDGKPLQPALKFPLDINNLLLRGCVLRKTEWVIGLAINVGNDSKIVQNMTKAPRKVSQYLVGCLCVWAVFVLTHRVARLAAG